MAIDKRGRKLPKGIRQRGNTFEGRFMYKGVSYTVQASTITKTQKEMTDLKYKLEHGLYVKKEKITLMEWYETWLEEYKKNKNTEQIKRIIKELEEYLDLIFLKTLITPIYQKV